MPLKMLLRVRDGLGGGCVSTTQGFNTHRENIAECIFCTATLEKTCSECIPLSKGWPCPTLDSLLHNANRAVSVAGNRISCLHLAGFQFKPSSTPLWQGWWHPGRSTGRLCRLDHKPNTTKTSLATGSPDRPQRLQSEAADPWDILVKTSTVLHPHVGRGGEIWVCDPWRPANTAGPTCDVTFAY